MKKFDIARYWKAVVGFVAPGAVIIGASVLDVSDGGNRVTGAELVTAAVACITTASSVYAVKNKRRPPAR